MPLLSWQPPTRLEARRAVALFPVVGALLGLLTACAWTLAARLWDGAPLNAGAAALATGAALSGGRAWGGVGRAVDGLAAYGAGGDRSRAFAVMRDPRRGTSGTVALAVMIALQLVFLANLPPAFGWRGLVLAGALGGWATAFGLAAFPLASVSVGEPEAAHGLADAGLNELFGAIGVVLVCAVLLPGRGIMVAVAVGAIVAMAATTIQQRLGGFSLPLARALGAVAELTALACLDLHVR